MSQVWSAEDRPTWCCHCCCCMSPLRGTTHRATTWRLGRSRGHGLLGAFKDVHNKLINIEHYIILYTHLQIHTYLPTCIHAYTQMMFQIIYIYMIYVYIFEHRCICTYVYYIIYIHKSIYIYTYIHIHTRLQ